MAANPKEKVLVYLFGSLGDSIVTVPALRAVRRHFSDAEIVVLQNFEAGDVVLASQVIPDELVDRYLNYNSRLGQFGRLSGFYRLWHQLRSERFDAAVYLAPSERPAKAVTRDRMFFRSTGIRDLCGFYPIPTADLYPVEPGRHPARSQHEAEFKLARLAKDGIEPEPIADFAVPFLSFSADGLNDIEIWIAERRRKPDVPLITVGPGCKQQVNAWTTQNFIELGRRLIAERPCEIIVVGGPAEFAMGEEMIASWGEGLNAAGTFSVSQSAALLSKSSLHIGLDTGTTHLAAAAGARCFVIYGERNNPGLWYPLGGGHTLLYHRVACAGCRVQECPVPGHPCMNDISVESVWYNLNEFLNGDASHRSSGVNVITV